MTSGPTDGPADGPSSACADGRDCAEVLASLERFLDGELTAGDAEGLVVHLGDCAPCGDRAEFERQVRVLIRSRLEDDVSPPPGLVDRIRDCLGGATAGAPERTDT